MDSNNNHDEEVIKFDVNCPNCWSTNADTKMKKIDIPFFKSVILMSTSCDSCGAKSNEVKSGNGISEKGIKFTLKLTESTDLMRDILKSDMASLEIPEIEFSLESTSLAGTLTTVEGILKHSHQQLSSFFITSDDEQAQSEDRKTMRAFLKKLESIYTGQMLDVTLVLDDPSGNSYIQNFYAPDDDPNMTVENYIRDYEQDDLLGLNDFNE